MKLSRNICHATSVKIKSSNAAFENRLKIDLFFKKKRERVGQRRHVILQLSVLHLFHCIVLALIISLEWKWVPRHGVWVVV